MLAWNLIPYLTYNTWLNHSVHWFRCGELELHISPTYAWVLPLYLCGSHALHVKWEVYAFENYFKYCRSVMQYHMKTCMPEEGTKAGTCNYIPQYLWDVIKVHHKAFGMTFFYPEYCSIYSKRGYVTSECYGKNIGGFDISFVSNTLLRRMNDFL